MTAQNIYDDPDFFRGYVTLDRQVHGLDGAAEWPDLRSMLPDVADQRIIDLGCGFGWFGRWALDQGAAGVLGVDVSTKMLARARAEAAEAGIGSATLDFRCVDLDQLDLEANTADLAFSSLALHYVIDLDRLLGTIASALTPGGSIVASVEHPIYSAPTSQVFETAENGDRVWPLNNYLIEGQRTTNWFIDGVVKQHPTIATYVNSLIAAGFELERIVEWGPSAEDVEERPELADDRHRPWFLLLKATCRGSVQSRPSRDIGL